MTETVETASPAPHADFLLDRQACLDLEQALGHEWLETDGLGGHAASTALLCPTRREHGLLAAVPPGHARPHLFLARLEELLRRPERDFPLSNARYPGAWSPTGYAALESFQVGPWPRWTYRVGRTTARREVLVVRGSPTVLVRYDLSSHRDDVELRVRPLLAFRELGALTFENLDLDPRVVRSAGGVAVRPYRELPALHLHVGGGEARFEADPIWYRSVEYRRDLAEGRAGHEDHFSPGWFTVGLASEGAVVLAATLEPGLDDPVALWEAEAGRRRGRASRARAAGPRGRLDLAADAYLARRPDGRPGLLASFPGSTQRVRDTLLAVDGLLLSRGRAPEAAEVLEGLLPYLDSGRLPDVLGTSPEDSDYASSDLALWLARAVRQYERAPGAVREIVLERFRPALEVAATALLDGQAPGIVVDTAGLLEAGAPDRATTWMDAVSRHGPVTPRPGCAVEVNALWYFLLAYLEKLAADAGDRAAARIWMRRRRPTRRAFVERFWSPESDLLSDTWYEGRRDDSVRPNMVIAASLEFSPLPRGRRVDVVRRARAELLTAVGLRTLSPKHPLYRGRIHGDEHERQEARHQGAVWPWLLGPYVEAWFRAFGVRRKRREPIRALLTGLEPALDGTGVGHLGEIYEGDAPHALGAAAFSAASTGEILRAWRMLEEARP